MAKTETVSINGKGVTVQELTMGQLHECFMDLPEMTEVPSLTIAMDHVNKILGMMTDDITMDDLMDFAPSEIRVLLDAIERVNDELVKLVKGLIDQSMMDQIREAVAQDFSLLMADAHPAMN